MEPVTTIVLNTQHYRSTYKNTRLTMVDTENAMCRLLMPRYRFLHAHKAEHLH